MPVRPMSRGLRTDKFRLSALLRAARLVRAARGVRQARHGTLRPRRDRHARGTDGRRAGRDGRRRCRTGRTSRRLGRWPDVDPAATYPERTQALILCGAEVKEEITEDWPWGELTRTDFERAVARLPELWGKGASAALYTPGAADPEFERRWWARVQTQAATPRVAAAFQRMAFDIDVRRVVPTITAPTLIIHRIGDKICHVENARFLSALPWSRDRHRR